MLTYTVNIADGEIFTRAGIRCGPSRDSVIMGRLEDMYSLAEVRFSDNGPPELEGDVFLNADVRMGEDLALIKPLWANDDRTMIHLNLGEGSLPDNWGTVSTAGGEPLLLGCATGHSRGPLVRLVRTDSMWVLGPGSELELLVGPSRKRFRLRVREKEPVIT